jgi:membrane-bound lytic murein transglycosylase A
MVHQTMNTSRKNATPASTINSHIVILLCLSRRSLLVPLSAVALALAACTSAPLPPEKPAQPPPPPPVQPPVQPPTLPAQPAKPATLQMVPATFAALPGWDKDDLRAAWPAFMSSCTVLVKQPTWKEACTIARSVNASDERAIRTFLKTFMEPNQVIAPDGATDGLITGYYEPLLHGSRKRAAPTRRRYIKCRTIWSRSTWPACILS